MYQLYVLFSGTACDNTKTLNERFVSKPLVFAKEVRLGRHFYTQLLLPDNEEEDDVTMNEGHCHSLFRRHVLVCGMTQSSAEQYSKWVIW